MGCGVGMRIQKGDRKDQDSARGLLSVVSLLIFLSKVLSHMMARFGPILIIHVLY